MGVVKVFAVLTAVLGVVIYLAARQLYHVPPIPDFEETWWGKGDPSKEDTSIKPFKINVSDDILKDLNRRLASALPFQEPLEGAKQHYGMNSHLLKDIVEFWKTKYDWREREKFLNQYPQYKVSVQGLNIHYVHVKPNPKKGVRVLPMLLLHGWPGSVREFYEIIPKLTTVQEGRDFVFEVIIPSLPGYGFSDAAVRPGLSAHHMAVIFKNLMKRIGFNRYYIQGGDWGSVIVQGMAVLYPDKVIGVHANFCAVSTPLANLKLLFGNYFSSLIAEDNEAKRVFPLSETFQLLALETGDLHIQATKPDTAGVALRESPVGLAAYIIEKFTTWTNPAWKDLEDGGLTKKFTLTNILDNVMIYWVTRSITTSMRLYAETFNKANNDLLSQNLVEVPSACARSAKDPYEITLKSAIKDKYPNLVQISDFEGGHFAAFELPDVLAKDIYEFVDKVEHPKKTVNTEL